MPTSRRQPTEEYDLSSIQPPVKLGINGAEQVARCLAGGSEEIKHLLRQECRIIFECCVCTSLFRSLANFLAHKRVYCKEDHILPSSDLASHVSILRQYVQTKAAAMATLAEGSGNQSKPLGSNADSATENLVCNIQNEATGLENGIKSTEKKTQVASQGETPKKKKVKSPITPSTKIVSGSNVEKSNSSSHEKSKSIDKASSSATEKLNSPSQEKSKSIDKGSSNAKKRRICDDTPINVKRSHVKRKLIDNIPPEAMNGDVNIADTFMNHNEELSVKPSDSPIKTRDSAGKDKDNAGKDKDSAKKSKAVKTKGNISIQSMECSVVMDETDVVKSPVLAAAASLAADQLLDPKPSEKDTPMLVQKDTAPKSSTKHNDTKAPQKSTKSPKDLGSHLLYPCLYCDRVFPGTRMAIDHLTAVHKRRKALNVSKIRTKIRKKAFVVKSGKKMRRFQKKSKSIENSPDKSKEDEKVNQNVTIEAAKGPEEAAEAPEDLCIVGKRGHVSHKCIYCSKSYLYKTVLEKHQESCIEKDKPAQVNGAGDGVSQIKDTSAKPAVVPVNSKANKSIENQEGVTCSKSSSKVPTPKSSALKKNSPKVSIASTPPKSGKSSTKSNGSSITKNPLKPVSLRDSMPSNCRVLGEIVISPGSSIKAEPPSPLEDPSTADSPNGNSSTLSTPESSDSKDNLLMIPVKSDYPCPYCMIKPRKSFELLFAHINNQHKDLRPSRQRVARFLTKPGLKCVSCKDPPRFFRNRIMLRRHQEKEHGMNARRSPTEFNGSKS